MKISPWFSVETNPSNDEDKVHHDNTSCMDGDNIPKKQVRFGTDNRTLCKQCARLDAAGR